MRDQPFFRPSSVLAAPGLAAPGRWIILQGLATPFFAVLARKIRLLGGTAVRVSYSGGDALFSGGGQRRACRVRAADYPAFYAQLFEEVQPHGILLFGDQRPVHRPAIALAEARGIAVLCIEEGYLRPGWLTLEAGGTNAASRLPTEPDHIMRLAAELADVKPPPGAPKATDMPARVRWDILHKAANILGRPFYPHYRTHRPYPMAAEARGWVGRFLTRGRRARTAARLWQRYMREKPDFFLLPLQLGADTQIRIHADVGGMDGFLRTALASFARYAPADVRLLVKNHPLDSGVVNYARLVGEQAAALGIADRVDFIEGGDLLAMLAAARGVALVNSTVGLMALAKGCPVHASGRAIYRRAGLTAAGTLDRFWQAPAAPDPALVAALLKLLKGACMVEGDLFSKPGIEAGSEAVLAVMRGARPRLARSAGGRVELVWLGQEDGQ